MMTDPEQPGLLVGFAIELDPLMRGIVAGEELEHVRDLVQKVMWHCQQAPHFERLWGAGWLYAIWGELDDIADRWPIDCGSSTEAIALREFKRAARRLAADPAKRIRDH
jgi:hypothetical protein